METPHPRTAEIRSLNADRRCDLGCVLPELQSLGCGRTGAQKRGSGDGHGHGADGTAPAPADRRTRGEPNAPLAPRVRADAGRAIADPCPAPGAGDRGSAAGAEVLWDPHRTASPAGVARPRRP